jgi:hypothetical protein
MGVECKAGPREPNIIPVQLSGDAPSPFRVFFLEVIHTLHLCFKFRHVFAKDAVDLSRGLQN